MLPFISIFNHNIPLYGLLITIGFTMGILLAARFPSKAGVPRQDIYYAACYAGIGVFVGAKILYLIIVIPQLMRMVNPPRISWELINVLFTYGFVFYGGVFGAILGIFIYARQFRLSFYNLVEIFIPSVPLIHMFGRIGCFCAGCCYGIPMESPFGFFFRSDSVAPHDIALFPVQLLEAILNLFVFCGIYTYSRKPRYQGRIIGFYFVSYGLVRFFLEYLRFDAERGSWFGISTSQWISLLLLPIGIHLLSRRAKVTAQA